MDVKEFGFSLENQTKPVNETLIVTYKPNDTVNNYKYNLYKDDKLVDTFNFSNSNQATIIMAESGVYKIEVTTYNNAGIASTISSGTYLIDKVRPVISVDQTLITMEQGSILDVYGDVKATDNVDGNLFSSVTTNYEELNFNELGLKKLIYTVTDEAGNIATKTVQINVIEGEASGLIYVQIPIIIALLAVAISLVLYRKSIALEKRLSKFSIEPIKDNSMSLFDNVNHLLNKIVFKMNKYITKSTFLTRYSTRFEKYTYMPDYRERSATDFIAVKFIVSFVFLLIAIFSKTIQYQIISPYEIFVPLLIGFFILDVVYMSKYRIHRSKVENDLLQAIIIMNNAFKSGRSITQAVLLVSTELDGPIAEEFKKMHTELTFGLSVDVVFRRFSDRIKIEEATYLTASLSILNRTGGNIIKVFSSIEKSLFGKKKLNLEMQALTSSSKLIMYVLFLVPIFFVVVVSMVSNTYFVPFFTTQIGLILLISLIMYYALYIVVVRKVMKVRM